MGTERRCAASAFVPSFTTLNECFPPSPRRRDATNDDDVEEEEEDGDDEEEDDDDDDDDDDEEGDPSSAAGGPELTRAERRELKKKQAAEKANKAGEDGDGDDDDLLVNPNHVTKKLNISDLSAPRELTRRERYVPLSHSPALFYFILFARSHHTSPSFNILCVVSRRRRKKPRSVIGR